MAKGKKPRTTIEEDTPRLPEDLVFAEILSKLPAKSLMRFKCVSKSWLSRISSDSSFIASHRTHHSNVDTELSILLGTYKPHDEEGQEVRITAGFQQRVSLLADQSSSATEIDKSSYMKPCNISNIVGSCDGLVCVQTLCPGEWLPRIALWNPETRQCRYVPESQPEEGSASLLGFGFDDQSNDYKIVKVVASELIGPLDGISLRAEVFAKINGRWRGGGGGVSGLSGLRFKSAVSAGGALHWLAYKKGSDGDNYSAVLSFGLRDEVLRAANAPRNGVRGNDMALCKWRGSLAAMVWAPEGDSWLWTASVSSEENNGVIMWSRMVRVSPGVRVDWLRGVWKDQFIVVRPSGEGLELSLHEPAVVSQARKLKGIGPCVLLSEAHEYVESLVSVF